jgi:hypothetical protein
MALVPSPSHVYEIEKACIAALKLPPKVYAQRVAKWAKFDISEKGFIIGMGAYLFYLSDMRIGYVLWQFPEDGKLVFPDVEVSEFCNFKFPDGAIWERAAEAMDDSALATQAVA